MDNSKYSEKAEIIDIIYTSPYHCETIILMKIKSQTFDSYNALDFPFEIGKIILCRFMVIIN